MKKTYNKLVRDKIPEIIEKDHQSCDIEELADLLEVVYAAAIARGYTIEDLESLRLKKRAERGGFNKKILLKSITCPK